MKFSSHLDGQNIIQLKRMLLQILADLNEGSTELTTEGQFAYNSESTSKRIVFYDGSEIQTVATIDDVFDGYGNTTYISDVEPTGLPTVGVIEGDLWFNNLTSELKLASNPSANTESERWTDISDVNVTYTLPLVEADKSYAHLSVFVYSDSATNVSNGNNSIWQNQSGSGLSTSVTIASEADLTSAGFIKIGGGTVPETNATVVIDKDWTDGSYTSNSYTITKSGLSYTIDLVNKTSKHCTVRYNTSNKIVSVNTELLIYSVKLTFGGAITENFKVTINF